MLVPMKLFVALMFQTNDFNETDRVKEILGNRALDKRNKAEIYIPGAFSCDG